VLLTTKWGSITNLVELISFGLTLTSLFLSLVAIVFAIFSNFSFSKSSADLQEASHNISEASDELQKATVGIEQKISEIPVLIDCLNKNVETSHQEVMKMLSEKEELRKPEGVAVVFEKDNIINFLSISSYSGLLSLLVCKFSKNTNTPFKLEDLKLSRFYSHGFLVACLAIGLLAYKRKNDMFTISSLNEIIESSIENSVDERIEYMCKKEQDPEKRKIKLETKKKQVADIRNYFKED
jgi:hypothetical protein